MQLKLTIASILTFAGIVTINPNPCRAQETTNQEAEREIKIGSHVLKQKGESAYSYDNDVYFYEKVWEAPNATKEEIYKRVKKWLANPTGATASDIVTDEDNKEFVTAGIEITLGNDLGGIKNQHITCKFRFSFKDGKVRLQATDFMYFAEYNYGYSSSVSYNANGSTTHSDLNTGDYKMKLHSLRPLSKGTMRNIYQQFDDAYLVVIRAMKKAILSADNNW